MKTVHRDKTGRPLEARLLVVVAFILMTGVGILQQSGTIQKGTAPFLTAALIVGSFFIVHLFLYFRKISGDELLLPLSAFLVILGWLEILRLKPQDAEKQLYWILAGLAVFVLWLCFIRDYRVLEDYKYIFLVGAVLLQGAVALFGHEVNGAKLWFNFGSFSIQPVEFVKLFLTFFLVAYLKQNMVILEKPIKAGAGLYRYFIPLFALWGIAESVLIIQKDLGMALLLFGVFMGLFYVTTKKGIMTLSGFLLFGCASYVLYGLFSHVQVRINNWLNPWQDPDGKGYQMIQALYSLAGGGILGEGLGRGKPYFIPAVHTDYIFVALSEELGLVGALVILSVFIVLIQRMFKSSVNCDDEFSSLLGTGLAVLFSTQVFVIVGGAVKLIPLTGITLPFVSYGGSSLVSNFILLALFMQISARNQQPNEQQPVKSERLNTALYVKKVYGLFSTLFFILALYIVYIMGVQSIPLASDPKNPRNIENLAKRGRILSRSGKPLALTKQDSKELFRHYPLKEAGEPFIGYLSKVYGKGGLEDLLDNQLKAPIFSPDPLEYILRYRPSGNDVFLTIDDALQKTAYESLGENRGAVVVMNPQNGEILALASTPSFNPEKLEKDWNRFKKNKDAPFLLRPVNGLYPPGSVFKLFTYGACLESGLVSPTDVLTCNGAFAVSYDRGTYLIREAGGAVHGRVTPADAIAYSCNVAFAQLGLKLGKDRFCDYAEKFGLNRQPDFILSRVPVSFPKPGELSDSLLAQSAFGQGEIIITPLQVALMVSAFCTDGSVYRPVLIKSIVNEKGKTVFKGEPLVWKKPVGPETARLVREAMVEVTRRGTGTGASIDGVEVAGKTGSAENPFGDTHAWYAGFAPAVNPVALVVVVVENGGGGGRVAAPIARRVLIEALKSRKNQ